MNVTITREDSRNHGTFGTIRAERDGDVFECVTLELPWRGNRRSLSCIPEGTYQCDWSHSGSFGKCYRLRDVPERSGILIHAGNYAGDRTRGLLSNVDGCILLGIKRGTLSGQAAILRSKEAIAGFNRFMDGQSFRLVIKSA